MNVKTLSLRSLQVHLKTAIESVIDQTYQNWQLIIINDASTDPKTKIILK